jgi:hypothetical protein
VLVLLCVFFIGFVTRWGEFDENKWPVFVVGEGLCGRLAVIWCEWVYCVGLSVLGWVGRLCFCSSTHSMCGYVWCDVAMCVVLCCKALNEFAVEGKVCTRVRCCFYFGKSCWCRLCVCVWG